MSSMNRMWVTEWEKIRSKLNGAAYTVSAINTASVILESADGWKRENKNAERKSIFNCQRAWAGSEVVEAFWFSHISQGNGQLLSISWTDDRQVQATRKVISAPPSTQILVSPNILNNTLSPICSR